MDGLVIPPALREKVTVSSADFFPALVGLTLPERDELKCGILQLAADGSLPGPLRADELCAYLDELNAAA
jgi:hypothetical protein